MAQQDAAEKCPPGKEQEADPSSSSSLSAPARPDQTRRRSWRPQRAQDSGSQTTKPVRINRVPLLRPESSSPSTAGQAAAGVSQDMALVSSSSSSSCPCRPQGLKRSYPEEEAEPQVSEGPPAKRRRISRVPAKRASTRRSSTTRRMLLRLRRHTQPAKRQAYLYRPPWLFHGSLTDNRSQPGPVRIRHVWRQQRREKKPYSRPDNQSRTRQAPARGARNPHPSQ